MGYSITMDNFIFEISNVKIRYMSEMILNSYKTLPKAFLGDNPFSLVEIDGKTIKIDIREWLPFQSKLIQLVEGNEIVNKCFSKCMQNNLNKYRYSVNELRNFYFQNGFVHKTMLKECFSLYSLCQGYAFWNYLPVELLHKLTENEECPILLDDFMISMVQPHRTAKRRRELELAIKNIKEELSLEDIDNYRNNDFILSKESEWNFYSKDMDSDKTIIRNIELLCKRMLVCEIEFELDIIKKSRDKQLNKIYNYLVEEEKRKVNDEKSQQYYRMIFLLNISTQEEYRHIINGRFMNLLGKLAYKHELNIARTSTLELIDSLSIRK